jgi:AcrR family transcriptional regulator
MNTREKILVGAKQYLLAHGQAGFTIRAIALEAGVNKGLVHHYFGSKENLVLELIEYVAVAPFEQIKQMVQSNKQAAVKDEIISIFLKNTDLANMIFEFMYLAQHSEKVKEKLRKIAKERRDFVAGYFGIEDPQEKYTLNASIFGILFFSRLEDDIDIKVALNRLFKQFHII